MKKLIGISILVLLLAVVGCDSKDQGAEQTTQSSSKETEPEEKKTEPETEKTGEVTWTKFSAMDLDENEVTSVLGDSPSKLTMVYIWGTYCPSCVASLPELAKIQTEYDVEDFNLVGIVVDATDEKFLPEKSNMENAKKILESNGATFVNLIPSTDLMDLALKDVMYIPETRFLDATGNQVGDLVVGGKTAEEYKSMIEAKLTELK